MRLFEFDITTWGDIQVSLRDRMRNLLTFRESVVRFETDAPWGNVFQFYLERSLFIVQDVAFVRLSMNAVNFDL